jgi:hypothetical protein
LQRNIQTENRGTLAKAFAQLPEIGLIETQREASEEEGFLSYASKTLLRLTWCSGRFQSLLTVGGSATQYIGSKVNHKSDKKVNHGAGPKISIAAPQNVCGDLSSFYPLHRNGSSLRGPDL